MPGKRVPMRKIRDVLRLGLSQGLSQRGIGRSLGLSQAVVNDYLRRARLGGLGWPLPEGLDDVGLEARLFPPPPTVPTEQRPAPDWALVHQELRRPNVTLALLWEEYRAGAPDGFGYSWFCDLYRAWAGRLAPTLRQVHPAGERLFVDYAGSTVPVFDGASGEERQAAIFVAVLGASSYTFACAAWGQGLAEWVGCHVRAFEHLGGVTRQLVSDNLRSGVSRACFHEPAVNRTYAEMAAHYGTAVLPARPYKPRDKAKAEVGVQVVQRWILARLRRQRFFSLAALNAAIGALVVQLNDRPMRGLGTTRRALFEALDRPALLPLPAMPYEYAAWKRCRVGLDYHVEIERHHYSVPHALVRQEVEARITAGVVEIFHHGRRVASHPRSLRRQPPSTLAEHMPSAHRRYREWTPERLRREAGAIGEDAAALVEVILRTRPHPEQGFRSCIGILGLVPRHGAERVDAACARALALGTRSYTSVAAILANRRERGVAPDERPALPAHENIRGPGYYH